VAEPAAPSGDFVQSVQRALAVITAFDAEHPQLSLADVSRRTGLNRAAARRFLHTLAALGYVRTDERLFALTPRVLELGYAYLSSLRLPEIAEPHLKELSRTVGESCSVSVLDLPDVVYVARAETRRIMHVRIAVGTRLPAYATSMGRVLLAALPPDRLAGYLDTVELTALTSSTVTARDRLLAVLDTVRSQGYAVVDQELEPGLRSVAAPIRGRDQDVVAAVNVSTSTGRRGSGDDPIPDIVPSLLTTAQRISADLSVAGN
jgi:IclR family transcriptional regulator, pca regulon regulatory protein